MLGFSVRIENFISGVSSFLVWGLIQGVVSLECVLSCLLESGSVCKISCKAPLVLSEILQFISMNSGLDPFSVWDKYCKYG